MAFKPKVIWLLLKEAYNNWSEDKAMRMGAAIAYYTVFSIAPLLLIAVGIAGLVLGERAAKQEIVTQIEGVVGTSTAQALQAMIKKTSASGKGGWATAVGIVILLIGASGVFVELTDALNTIWKVTPRPGRALWEMLRERLLSFIVIVGIGLLLLAAIAISTGLSALGQFVAPASQPGAIYFWQVVNGIVSLVLVALLFALMFKALPDVSIAWRDVWIGAFISALLFSAGKYLIALYLARSSMTSAYGAAGSLVLILLWVYYSSLLFLFGAEFTRVYARWSGSPIMPTNGAVPLSREALARQGIPRTEGVEQATRGAGTPHAA